MDFFFQNGLLLLLLLYFLVVFLMEITHIESAWKWEVSRPNRVAFHLSKIQMYLQSLFPYYIHTVSVFYEKKYSQFIRLFLNIIWFPSGAWWDLIFLFSFRPYFRMLRNIGPNHLYISIPNIRNILRQLCLKWSIPID